MNGILARFESGQRFKPQFKIMNRIYKSRLTTEQKELIRAHSESKNGLKLGISKEDRKPNSSAELFKVDNQINLF